MVVTSPVRTLIVPDEQTWTVLGTDPAGLGLEPVFALGAVERVLVPTALPAALVVPLGACLDAVSAGTPTDSRPLAVPGGAFGQRAPDAGAHHGPGEPGAADTAHGDHGGGDHGGGDRGGEDHGGEDHGDMMAIVGDPSRDGLVMESMDLRHGPLGTSLPGGLVVDVTLDGDVVSDATVSALLSATADPLAPVAGSAPPGWAGVAAIEVERAISHLAWLRAFARVLGWPSLVHDCTTAITACADPEAALPCVRALAATLRGSRRLRARTAGQGIVSTAAARKTALRGPNARASGLPADLRSVDARYRALGFAPVTADAGDARARALVRVDEACAALALAAAASATTGPAPEPRWVEDPRGGDGTTARRVAAAAMVGAEWATALVVLASFDLSAWRVRP